MVNRRMLPRADEIRSLPGGLGRRLPGLALCLAVAGAAVLGEAVERAAGRVWLDAVVLAILLGAVVRAAWTPGPAWAPGIAFCARTVLETAIVLLGATVSARALLEVGPGLLAGIVGLVAAALGAGYLIGRWLGLTRRLALLTACGNAICGNSAIVAVAPVIGAGARDVAAAVAFTAVLGLAVVLILPLLAVGLGLSDEGYGVFAGLTVYAVPQVLAATAPISSLSAQVGALVKLARVLMLGPVVLALSLLARRLPPEPGAAVAAGAGPRAGQLVPWFIIGFLLMLAARSADWIPDAAALPLGRAADALTVVAMAALGLGVDVRVVARAGARVSVAVVLSLLLLGALALILIRALGLW